MSMKMKVALAAALLLGLLVPAKRRMTINRGIVGALISGPWVSASFRRIATRDAMIWGTDTDIGLGEVYQASHIPPGTITVTRNTASIS